MQQSHSLIWYALLKEIEKKEESYTLEPKVTHQYAPNFMFTLHYDLPKEVMDEMKKCQPGSQSFSQSLYTGKCLLDQFRKIEICNANILHLIARRYCGGRLSNLIGLIKSHDLAVMLHQTATINSYFGATEKFGIMEFYSKYESLTRDLVRASGLFALYEHLKFKFVDPDQKFDDTCQRQLTDFCKIVQYLRTTKESQEKNFKNFIESSTQFQTIIPIQVYHNSREILSRLSNESLNKAIENFDEFIKSSPNDEFKSAYLKEHERLLNVVREPIRAAFFEVDKRGGKGLCNDTTGIVFSYIPT